MDNKYKHQYLNPKWQKKRLEVLERDNFTCNSCGRTDKTLHVHHNYYIKDRDVWNYNLDSLDTLCEDCHIEVKENTTFDEITFNRIFHIANKINKTTDKKMYLKIFNSLIKSPYSGIKFGSKYVCCDNLYYKMTWFDILEKCIQLDVPYKGIKKHAEKMLEHREVFLYGENNG